jgi:catechol 2,3-dioxygenase-like lactoylglutathione lyase family enzyme
MGTNQTREDLRTDMGTTANPRSDSKDGKLCRRQVIQGLGVAAAAAFAATSLPRAAGAFATRAAEDQGQVFPVVTINHLSLAAADYAKSRDWYVDLFGMRVVWDNGKMCALEFGSMTEPNGLYIRNTNPNEKPNVGHFAFGTADYMIKRAAMKAELERRGLKNIRPDGGVGWTANDPAGYLLNAWVPIKDKAMYPGAAEPCGDPEAAACKAGWESGLKDLGSIHKASGKGFKATSYSHVVLNVPETDIPKERDFYSGMYGMKVIYENLKGANPQVFLRFGRNTLYLRKTADPGDKPYCNHYAFVVENYEQAAAEKKLKALGFDPKPDSKLAWTVTDPDGMRIEVAGWGLPEHIANDCKGSNSGCPGGPKG